MIKNMKAAALATILALGTTTAQAASVWEDYSSFWVLGDSLSDTGNVAAISGGTTPGPAYYQNRFSNGPIWADYFTSRFQRAGKATGSAAFGGAVATTNSDFIPDLMAQTGIYRAISAGKRGVRPLVSLWFGGNDIGNLAGTGTALDGAISAAKTVVDNAISLLDTTSDFLIFNMPDVGATPRFQFTDIGAAAEATAARDAFNKAIVIEVARLEAAGGNVTLMDISALEGDLASFGILNSTTPCLVGGVLVCDDQQLAVSQYWDPFHPTAATHRVIGQQALSQFGAVPIPASAPLLLLGFALIGMVARKRKA